MEKKYAKIKIKKFEPITTLKNKPVQKHDFNSNKSKFFQFLDRRKTKKALKKQYSKIMINMELENGMHRIFVVSSEDNGFKFREGKYLLDDESKYYNVENNIWCYDFHERFSIPIKRTLPIAELTKSVEEMDDMEMEYAINPLTIKRFAVSKIAEGIMKGQALDKALQFLTYVCVIGTLATVFLLLLFMFKTGMFQSVAGAVGV